MASETLEDISIPSLKSQGENLLRGLLYKYVTLAGRGEFLTENSEVQLELRMMVKGKTLIDYPEQSPYVKLIEHVLPPGLRIALLSMKVGESALVWVDSLLGFGSRTILLEPTTKKILKNSDIVFEVFLKSSREPYRAPLRWNKLAFESIPSINEEMERAVSEMQRGRKLQALKILRACAHKARRLPIDAVDQPDEERSRNILLFELTKTTAECAFDMGRFPLAVSLAKEALQVEPFNAQLNYICGSAYFALGFTSPASRFLRLAHFNDISNEMYGEKLRHLERHESLLHRDVADEMEVREEVEEFAANLMEKIRANEKTMRTDVQAYINLQLKLGVRSITIGGGYRPQFLATIAEKISRRHYGVRTKIDDDSIYLDF